MDKPIKLLVIDDEEGIVDYVKRMFTRRGYDAFGATVAKEAIDIFKFENPDICIIDVLLDEPAYDGIDVLKEIKESNKDAVCIMMTRITDEEKVERAKELGAMRYIFKPLGVDELLKVVDEAKSIVEAMRGKNG